MQNTSRSECMEKRRGCNGGQKDFQKTEGEGLLCGASEYLWVRDVTSIRTASTSTCENNWIRKIGGVRRVERRRMKDLREKVGNKACIVGKIVKSRMKWTGHMVRMNDDKLPKRS